MKRLFALAGALAALALPGPAAAFDPARLGRTVEAAGLDGVVLVSRGDTILYARAFGTVEPGGERPHRLDARWRWASITKQIVASLVMQEVAAGNLALDRPIGEYWPDFPNARRGTITVRQLLQHTSGLPNPENTPPDAEGLPAYYTRDWTEDGPAATGYCAGPSIAEPGTGYSYNNCDYIVLGGLLERVTGTPLAVLIADRIDPDIRFYPEGTPTVPGFRGERGEPPIRLAAYGAAGGLNGTVLDLWRFDRQLMTGALLDDAARAALWEGNPAYGHAALGQWAFETPLAGCRAPVWLIERRGAIGGIQGRNFILPDLDMAVIAFANRAEGDFDFGEIWQGAGFAHDILVEAACHWDKPGEDTP